MPPSDNATDADHADANAAEDLVEIFDVVNELI